ncbi:hypothetical protein [Methylorubrum sp. GM97]|uniref:hypothetical protein n=1 Tax=Methylorubrum sp. GM97 TaxID=2938232 RepID=UPI00218AE886|nr:hypothetical protein [Methylorubrum sp. GM97]BDL39024.1 hypothetical protein MSPGM_16140 [Methylorubrum sp. GM97]
MTDTAPSRETSAARRRIAAADRAREWRERQRETEAARHAELEGLRAEVVSLRAERDRLQAAPGHAGAASGIDEDLARAFVKMAGMRRSATGSISIAHAQVAAADVIAVAAYIRCGGRAAGQVAYDADRRRVLERLKQFLPPPGET